MYIFSTCTTDGEEKNLFHEAIGTNLFIIRFACEQTESKDQSNQSSYFTHT